MNLRVAGQYKSGLVILKRRFGLKAPEHLQGWHTLGDVEALLECAVEIDRLARDRVGEEVLGLHQAEHLIQILTGHQSC
jgi:hypothetical protein